MQIAASLETAFWFFTDPSKMVRWQGIAGLLVWMLALMVSKPF